MKRLIAIVAASLVVAVTVFGCAAQHPRDGWVALIDGGAGLDNFNRIGDANWRVEGGAIVADKGKGGHLVTKKSYKDFVIYAEFYAESTTNSGIFMRVSDPRKIGAANAYEANIYDQRPDPLYGTGAVPNVAMVNPMPKAGGKWNTYEIHLKGSQLTVKLNGVVTVHAQDSKYASGPISLQFASGPKGTPGGAIKWRKVAIKEL